MPEQSDSSPTPGRDPAATAGPTPAAAAGGARRHRVVVWSLIALASLVLVVSITANWVQLAVLDNDEVKSTTDEILADEDVQQALSIYAVDQLYANVDVQGELAKRLPGGAKALAGPAAAAARQLAVNAEERALSSPRVQALVSGAIGRAHAQFVDLIRNEDRFVETGGGEVTLNYGDAIADLAARLGVSAATISNVRDVVQDFSGRLEQRLTAAQGRIKAVRGELSDIQRGELSSQLRGRLESLDQRLAALERQIGGLEQKIGAAQGKVPAPLQGRLAELERRLSNLDGRLTQARNRTAAVLADPSQANVAALDASLASVEARIDALLARQIVQNPGQLVVMRSSQLEGVQNVVAALRNLGLVLPLLALLLYLGALYLAKGWRRRALIGVGCGIVAATLLVLLVRRLGGSAVVDSLASSATVEPAIRSVWDIVTDTLRQRALSVLAIGLAFIGAGLLAGPGRRAVAVRRFLAPYLRDQPVVVYALAAVLFLLWLAFMPGITNVAQVLAIVVLAALAVVGIELLRRQTADEFPP